MTFSHRSNIPQFLYFPYSRLLIWKAHGDLSSLMCIYKVMYIIYNMMIIIISYKW